MARQYVKVVGVGGGRGGSKKPRAGSAPRIAKARNNGTRKG